MHIYSLILILIFFYLLVLPIDVRADKKRPMVKEFHQIVPSPKMNFLDDIKNKIKEFRFSATITGTLKSIIGKILVITADKDKKDYTIYVSDKTQMRRRFWGNSQLSEFVTGDKVVAIGSWRNSARTEIDADLIRDISIQKRWRVFIGNVTAKTDQNFTIKPLKRDAQTVTFDANTKFVANNEKSIKYSDVKIGDQVRVKGIWDVAANKIINVSQVKDFSIK